MSVSGYGSRRSIFRSLNINLPRAKLRTGEVFFVIPHPPSTGITNQQGLTFKLDSSSWVFSLNVDGLSSDYLGIGLTLDVYTYMFLGARVVFGLTGFRPRI